MEGPTSSCFPVDWSHSSVTCCWSEFVLAGCTEHTVCVIWVGLCPPSCWQGSLLGAHHPEWAVQQQWPWVYDLTDFLSKHMGRSGDWCIWHLDVPTGLQGAQGKAHCKMRSPCSDRGHQDWPPHCIGSVLIFVSFAEHNRFWNFRSCHETNSLFASQLSLRVMASPCLNLLKSEITQKKPLSLHRFIWRNVTCDHLLKQT